MNGTHATITPTTLLRCSLRSAIRSGRRTAAKAGAAGSRVAISGEQRRTARVMSHSRTLSSTSPGVFSGRRGSPVSTRVSAQETAVASRVHRMKRRCGTARAARHSVPDTVVAKATDR